MWCQMSKRWGWGSVWPPGYAADCRSLFRYLVPTVLPLSVRECQEHQRYLHEVFLPLVNNVFAKDQQICREDAEDLFWDSLGLPLLET